MADLFLNTRKDNDIGVHGHTDGQDNTCDARKRKRHLKGSKQDDNQCNIQAERDGRCKTRHQINGNHEHAHDAEADGACQKARGDGFLAKLRADHVGADLLKLQGKGADADGGRKLICLLVRGHSCDGSLSACDSRLDNRVGIYLAVVDDGDALSDVGRRHVSELLSALVGERKAYLILLLACLLILIDHRRSRRHIGAL